LHVNRLLKLDQYYPFEMNKRSTHPKSGDLRPDQSQPNYLSKSMTMMIKNLLSITSRPIFLAATFDIKRRVSRILKPQIATKLVTCCILILNLVAFTPSVVAQFTITRVTADYFDSGSNNPG
jgi:hypothetical protein